MSGLILPEFNALLISIEKLTFWLLILLLANLMPDYKIKIMEKCFIIRTYTNIIFVWKTFFLV